MADYNTSDYLKQKPNYFKYNWKKLNILTLLSNNKININNSDHIISILCNECFSFYDTNTNAEININEFELLLFDFIQSIPELKLYLIKKSFYETICAFISIIVKPLFKFFVLLILI